MKLNKISLLLLMMVAVSSLLSCKTSTPETPKPTNSAAATGPDLAATYQQLASAGGKQFVVNPKTSAVRIYAFRGGRAGKVGHNHVLSAPQFKGFVHLPDSGVSDARFDLEFRLDQLEIDNVEYRAGLGKAFASVLSPAAIEGTRDHMLGSDNMEAERFPFVRIHSLLISGEEPKLAAKIEVEIHGQKREMWVPLTVGGLPDKLSVSGSFVVRQTDFGAKPYSVLGGLLAVKDEVLIEFNLLSE